MPDSCMGREHRMVDGRVDGRVEKGINKNECFS